MKNFVYINMLKEVIKEIKRSYKRVVLLREVFNGNKNVMLVRIIFLNVLRN